MARSPTRRRTDEDSSKRARRGTWPRRLADRGARPPRRPAQTEAPGLGAQRRARLGRELRLELRLELARPRKDRYPIRQARLRRAAEQDVQSPRDNPYTRWLFETPAGDVFRRRSPPQPEKPPPGPPAEVEPPATSEETDPELQEPETPLSFTDRLIDFWVRLERRELTLKDVPGEELVAHLYFKFGELLMSPGRTLSEYRISIVLLLALGALLALSANALLRALLEYIVENLGNKD